MPDKSINIFWFRRDLRLQDNAGLYHALKSGLPVLPVFILDRNILDKLEDRDDARITFICNALEELNKELKEYGSSLFIVHDTAEAAWQTILNSFEIENVYTNHDYEPYARKRDKEISELLKTKSVGFKTYKDQVIFERSEVIKEDQAPYTVYTPYQRKWKQVLVPAFHFKAYPTSKYAKNLYQDTNYRILKPSDIGFKVSKVPFPDKNYKNVIDDYAKTRDYPALDGTSRISVHLRFGTVSIRKLAADAFKATEKTWLNELIWREFYMMILWHFPHTVDKAFKSDYDKIKWRNNENEFKAWCEGKTGYPIVDAGMRQLNEIGWMHNRVRMITASFLVKHLLIDWRWGEAYFARKLIDYEQPSNIGGWQWAASSGNDAVPYFRIFNPDLQTQKFDPKAKYIRKWIPEFDDPFQYPPPIVDHKTGRERALSEFKKAISK